MKWKKGDRVKLMKSSVFISQNRGSGTIIKENYRDKDDIKDWITIKWDKPSSNAYPQDNYPADDVLYSNKPQPPIKFACGICALLNKPCKRHR